MNFEKIKLKDINCIKFNIDNLEFIKGEEAGFNKKNAKIVSVLKEKGLLKIIVSDGKGKAIFKMLAKNNQGRNAIELFLISRKVVGTSLRDFPNLEFGYFKK